jgi:hypothetical protein
MIIPIASVGASSKRRLVFIPGEKYDFIRFCPAVYLCEGIATVMELKSLGLVIRDFFIAQDKDITIGLMVFLPF